MDSKYMDPVIESIWSEEGRFTRMAEVEFTNCEALHYFGRIPKTEILIIRQARKLPINWEVYKRRFQETRHDVSSLVFALAYEVDRISVESGSPLRPGRWIHQDLTSYDPWDTALAMQIRETLDRVDKGLRRMMRALKRRGLEHWDTPVMGRTHGTHAEETTFGTQLANYWAMFKEHLKHVEEIRQEWNIVKISGPVGTHEKVSAKVEEYIAREFGIRPIEIATQIVPREKILRLLNLFNEIGATVERVATNWRYQSAPEIFELAEAFPEGAEGSSIMVHKQNPEVSERCCSLAHDIAGSVTVARMNTTLWLERDLSNSASERRIMSDTSHMVVYILDQMAWVTEKLEVYPERMRANIALTAGLIKSGKLLNLLVEKGVERAEARKLVRSHVVWAWGYHKKGQAIPSVEEAVLADREIMSHLRVKEVRALFRDDYEALFRGVKVSFRRLGWRLPKRGKN